MIEYIVAELGVIVRDVMLSELDLLLLCLSNVANIRIELRLGMLLLVDQTGWLVSCQTDRRDLDLRNRTWASGIHCDMLRVQEMQTLVCRG